MAKPPNSTVGARRSSRVSYVCYKKKELVEALLQIRLILDENVIISQKFRKTQYKNSLEGKEISMRSKNTSGAHTRYSTQYYWALTL